MSWQKVVLGDIAMNIQTGPFGSQLHQSDYSKVGIPVVMPKDLLDGKIIENSVARVEEIHVERLNRYKIKEGDIIYSRRGDVGRCAFAGKKEAGWLCGTGCLCVTIDVNKANAKFVFYQLQLAETIGWVKNHAVGSTMLNLNTNILGNIPINIPDLSIQNRIVSILSVYDDLIANNKRQIKLLEEMAQRLYKEWFVDLHFPGYEDVEIVDGVPEGWKCIKLEAVIDVCYGKDHKNISDGDINVYGSGGIIRRCSKFLFKGESVLIPRKGSLNNILYVDEAFWTVDTMFFTKMKMKNVGVFVYLFLKTLDMYSLNTGSAVPSMTVKIINNLEIVFPCEDVLNLFNKTNGYCFKQIKILNKQIELAQEEQKRLITKLMTGELEDV